MDTTLYGIASRKINGSDRQAKTLASIPAGAEVRIIERSGDRWEISARGVRTLPMTWGQLIARVTPV